jgi:hypothetical protein
MKVFLAFFCLIIFIPNTFAKSGIVPIIDMRYSAMIGGVKDKKWVKASEVVPTLKAETEFIIAGFKGVEEGAVTWGKKREDSGVCDTDYISFEFDLESETGVGLGSGAKWNPVPRIPQKLDENSKIYTKIVADFLRTKRILKSPVKTTRAFRVDLDGDGTEEVILSATYYKKGMLEEQNIGDYSFILLRKVVKGKAQNILVAGEFINKIEEFSPPNEYEISGIADLNGDGKMEITANISYYEGVSHSVFEIQDGKAVEVLQTGCGL